MIQTKAEHVYFFTDQNLLFDESPIGNSCTRLCNAIVVLVFWVNWLLTRCVQWWCDCSGWLTNQLYCGGEANKFLDGCISGHWNFNVEHQSAFSGIRSRGCHHDVFLYWQHKCLILRELDFFSSRTVHQIAFIQNAVSRDGKTGVALICRSEVFQPWLTRLEFALWCPRRRVDGHHADTSFPERLPLRD